MAKYVLKNGKTYLIEGSSTTKKQNDGGLDFFQKGAFDDGYQFGDVTKSILGTAGDVGLNFLSGAFGVAEGITDFFGYLEANRAERSGNKVLADQMRKGANISFADSLVGGADDYLDRYSIAGRTTDAIAQGAGQVATTLLTGNAAGAIGLGSLGTTALTTGAMGLSGAGSGMSEAYRAGATDKEALTYGLISGAADAITEMIFGGLGKSVKALGISSGLSSADDMLAKTLTKNIKNTLAKNAVQFGVKAGAEGLEEVLAGGMQALGKKMTYMSEEELSDIIKDENLLEQFIVGGLTSGIAQVGDVRRANKSGQDYITGYTENEQKVYDKVYEKLVAEKEANGKKLTSKEKNAIHNRVQNMMEKGYVSTETIAEVLGGDDFKSLKSAKENFVKDYNTYKDTEMAEQALGKEYDTLKKKIESGDYSYEELSRFNDLVGKKNEYDKSTNQKDLKAKLIADNKSIREMEQKMHTDVSEMVKGTRLAESYNEVARSKQKYEADVSKYTNEKAKQTIQNIMDSGVANNTREFHEFADWLAKISADKGVAFSMTDAQKLKGTKHSFDGKKVNGFIDENGNITLNKDAANALNFTVGHEITHVLEGTEFYKSLKDAVFNYSITKEGREAFNKRLKETEERYKGISKDPDGELMADLIGEYLFSDYDFVNNLAKTDRNLFQKIFDEIKYMLKVATAGSKEARELEKVKHYFEKAYNENIKGKPETEQKNTTNDGGVKYSYADSNSTTEDVVSLDGGTVAKYSLSTWTPETQTKVRDNLVKAGYEEYRVDNWIKDVNGVAAVIASDKDRLDFEAADNQVMLKDNQEYIKTLDASTLCAKRLVYQGTFDAIQHRMPNKMLSSDDLIDLLNMMKEHGVQTPCGVCYVESRRRHLGKFAQEWLSGYDGEYKPKLDEVTTSDGLEKLRKSHPQTYKDFVDAMNKKGSSNPKVVQLRTEYRNEIMSLTPAQIRKIEAIGGLRVQSFSDFETPHMLDMMQAVMDMSAKGLHSQAYTKVPNFAWVFGDTGIKINLSLIAEGDGFDADGNLAFSSTEGMNIDDALQLRDAYSQNVGTIIVGANDKHILACMADDRIDFIIPFHRSGWGMKELDMMGMSSYTDYTYGQKEHDLATGKGVENLYPPDYWDYNLSGKENAERYLKLCAKTGREPKFSKFLVNNGDGSYSLQPDGSTDGYWKMLIDFKMYDNDGNGAPQQKVQPNFNMNEAYRVLQEYEGGANKLPVANDVVEEFVAKYQASEDFAPLSGTEDQLSLSDGAEQRNYGNYNYRLQDRSWYDDYSEFAPMPEAENIAPAPEVETAAPVDVPEEDLAEIFPDDLLPLQGELSSLLAEKDVLENRLREVTQRLSSPDATEQDMADFQQVSGEYDALIKRIAELEQEIDSVEPDRFDGLMDEDAPPEIERIDNTPADTVSLSKKNITDIAREVKDSLGLNNKQMYDVHKLIEDYGNNEFPSREKLFQDIKEKLGTYTEKYKDQGTADAKKELRTSPLLVDDIIRGEIADFNDLRKRNRGKIRFSRSGIPVDVKYIELSNAWPYLFPESIINPTDQFLRIVEVANMDSTATNEQPIDDATLWGVTDDIIEYVSDIKQLQKETDANRESREAFNSLMKDADKYVPLDDIAPPPAFVAEEAPVNKSVAPTVEKPAAEAPAVDKPIKTVKERLSAKLENFQTELAENQRLRQASWGEYDQEIARLQADYNARKNKATVGANDILRRIESLKRMQGNVDADYAKRISDLEANTAKVSEEIRTGESATEQGAMRRELHTRIVDDIKTNFAENGLDFDKVLKEAKNLSTFATVDNTPQRVMEKSLGYKAGQVLSDMTVNKVAQNETEGIKWLNSFTDRKSGLLKKISEKYNIKPGSKESAAAQMYAEGFYVNDQNEIIQYGDAELAKDFPDADTQARIKGLSKDPRIRKIYDETLAMINESRARNAYPEIQKLDNYFLHFRAMDDTFSRLGLPFNPNDIKAKDLPTDLNGVTADLKPGQPYFASAMHRKGKRTSFDLLGGLERYLTSAKDQIYHIDDIQTLRALRNYIADTYGQAKGLEDLDLLTEEEAQAKIKDVYNSHLSTFAKFLNEEANVIAGKTSLIDRGLEGVIGRRGITFLNTINQQVGKNMVGFNVSSSLTNILPVVQTFAKTNKADFVKAFAQTASNKIGSINGKSDGFAEASPVIIRRKGSDRFYRTPYQKIGDAGYVLMGAIDNVSTELIARTKYNELVRKGMDTEQAHIETDKWVSRLMGDRSLGQQPQIYNSKMLGLITKFQLEVRNQLDSQFYDTIQEANVATEDIEKGLARNANKAAKITSTFVQLAVAQHLFGKAFESVAGYNPAFDIIDVLIKAFGWDDDEEDEDTALDNLEEGFLALLEDLPYTSTFTGGRIPIESALPIEQFVTGKDDYGNDKSRWETLKEAAPYYLLPGGYGQIKKTKAGLDMFSDEHPIAGSYTDSGNLLFPVEDNLANRAQAAVFGQWASKNARDYFDNDWAPLNEKQTQEFIDVDIPIQDYRAYREGLKGKDTDGEKVAYIAGLDLPIDKQNLLANNLLDRKEPIDLADWYANDGLEEFDYAKKYPEKYMFLEANGISVEEYNDFDEDTKRAYTWAYQNPGKFAVSKVVANDLMEYRLYTSDLNDIEADKDKYGNSISGSVKEKRIAYINGLDLDYGQKIILYRSMYNSSEDRRLYNAAIVEYLNSRTDLSYEEKTAILEELGFTITADGRVRW